MSKHQEIIQRAQEVKAMQATAEAEPPQPEENDPFADNGYEDMTGNDWKRHASAFGLTLTLKEDHSGFLIRGDKNHPVMATLRAQRDRILAALIEEAGAKKGPDLVTLFDETFNEGQPAWLEVEE